MAPGPLSSMGAAAALAWLRPLLGVGWLMGLPCGVSAWVQNQSQQEQAEIPALIAPSLPFWPGFGEQPRGFSGPGHSIAGE